MVTTYKTTLEKYWISDYLKLLEIYNYGSEIQYLESMGRGICGQVTRRDPIMGTVEYRSPFYVLFLDDYDPILEVPPQLVKQAFSVKKDVLRIESDTQLDIYLIIDKQHFTICSPAILPLLIQSQFDISELSEAEYEVLESRWSEAIILLATNRSEYLPLIKIKRETCQKMVSKLSHNTLWTQFVKEYWKLERNDKTFKWTQILGSRETNRLYLKWKESWRTKLTNKVNSEFAVDHSGWEPERETFKDLAKLIFRDQLPVFKHKIVPHCDIDEYEITPLSDEEIRFYTKDQKLLWELFVDFHRGFSDKEDIYSIYEITEDVIFLKDNDGTYILLFCENNKRAATCLGLKSSLYLLKDQLDFSALRVFFINFQEIDEFNTMLFRLSAKKTINRSILEDVLTYRSLGLDIVMPFVPAFVPIRTWEWTNEFNGVSEKTDRIYLQKIEYILDKIKRKKDALDTCELEDIPDKIKVMLKNWGLLKR
ncbi:MAG: hypothetical protein GF364_09825 [Candidatus Lokiarchaeota archaeon]|nr:hypothetical protein [Candidatus Lokiarchaeota archaeon]